jgi:hypothetical protein
MMKKVVWGLFVVTALASSTGCEMPNGGNNHPPETAATPIASPGSGAVQADTAVSLSTATEGAVIYYTVDGADPTSSGAPYTSPIAINVAKTIKAVAKKSGMADSGMLTAAYTIDDSTAAADFTHAVSDDTVAITGYTGSATNIVIPGTIGGLPVTVIGENAFQEKHLTSVTIPDGVTTIGAEAFANNPLTGVTIGAGVVLGNGAFPGDLGPVYTNGGSQAGTYTRSSADSTTWSKQEPDFVAVASIDGVPTGTAAGEALVLSGTVSPGNATNKTIVWSVRDAGTSGAVIAGNTLNTTAAGTVIVTATIVNGQTPASDYTQDFTISITIGIVSSSLEAGFVWLQANAAEGGEYTYILRQDEAIDPHDLDYSGKAVSITLVGDTPERTVRLSANGSLFTVESGVTLTLGAGVTLQGKEDNTASLVMVNSGGTLVMNAGSKISGNTASDNGGGVYVESGAFTMNGGEISGNTSGGVNDGRGGGVYVYNSTFTMSGDAVVSGNTASGGNNSRGGGVYVYGSTFTMSGDAVVSGNTTSGGGGVCVYSGTFTMSGDAVISGNTASYAGGGGVLISTDGTFTINGGKISGNTASYVGRGGGVYALGGTFTMTGGNISGNTSGGGVCLGTYSKFQMTGGTISGNTASHGSGVYSGGTFTMSGDAVISGNTGDFSGVYVSRGTFTMSGNAVISGNTGGGVDVGNGTFTMTGGKISGNTGRSGVSFASNSGTFTMSGGEISGNTASYGGGVNVSSGTFTMSGNAVISGNVASYNGGGVYVASNGTFTKSGGGTIYGDTDTTHTAGSTENTATSDTTTSGNGHAVYVATEPPKKRNTTAGPDVKLDSTKTGNAGGWE